jgi:hypothetical protein
LCGLLREKLPQKQLPERLLKSCGNAVSKRTARKLRGEDFGNKVKNKANKIFEGK